MCMSVGPQVITSTTLLKPKDIMDCTVHYMDQITVATKTPKSALRVLQAICLNEETTSPGDDSLSSRPPPPPNDSFSRFSVLPTEIRCMIWKEAAPRLIRVSMGNALAIYHAQSDIASTCQEARFVYSKESKIQISNSEIPRATLVESRNESQRKLGPNRSIAFLRNDIFYIQDLIYAMTNLKTQNMYCELRPALKYVANIALVETQIRYTYMKETVQFLTGLENLEKIYVITDPQLPGDGILATPDNFRMKSPGMKDLPATQYLMANRVLHKLEIEYRKLKENGWRGKIPQIVWKIPG